MHDQHDDFTGSTDEEIALFEDVTPRFPESQRTADDATSWRRDVTELRSCDRNVGVALRCIESRRTTTT